MLGRLPTTLNVEGVNYKIRSDYRNILQIFTALEAKDLTDQDKFLVLLQRMYIDFDRMPTRLYESAYKAACEFIDCGGQQDKPGPKTLNWAKDEQLIFPAVNKVAGVEVRGLSYLHWWTFLGYFQSIDREDLLGQVLIIRQKQAKGKKLEKYEQEFLHSNRLLCALETESETPDTKQTLNDIFNSLLSEDGDR